MKNKISFLNSENTKADFLRDGKKKHKHPYGNFKFYACPLGLIKQENT